MLEHYFTKPQTADRIKESWIGQSIEKYVVWLSDQGYAATTVHRRVPLLRRFGEVAWDHFFEKTTPNTTPSYPSDFSLGFALFWIF
jgi:site-specific recombinase XerD